MSESPSKPGKPADPEPMDQFSAHLDRGWDLIHRGDFAGALVSAQKSLEIDAQSPEAHNLLGFVCAAQGQPEEALEHYKQAIALDDGFVEAMLNAAEVLIHPLREFQEAVVLLDDALDLAEGDDETADALLLKFDAYMQSGDRQGAARVARALPRGPFENPQMDLFIGRALFEIGNIEDARTLISRAIERQGDNADAHYHLGLVQDALDDPKAAAVSFLRARDLDLHGPRPRWALGAEQFEQRVQLALRKLHAPFAAPLEGALVVVCEAPGAEVVADGIDPRTGVLLDDLSNSGNRPRVGRVFVYQRNIERVAANVLEADDELRRCLEHELAALDPELAKTLQQHSAQEPDATG